MSSGSEPTPPREGPLGRDTWRRLFQAVGVQGLAVAVVWGVWPEGLRHPHLWLVLMVGLAANLLQPTYSLVEGSRTEHDRASGVQIVWTVYAVQVLALAEWLWRRPPAGPDTVSFLAAILMLGGLVLRTWAVQTLGRFFTWNVEVQGGQTVVEEGPYRTIRHPSYTGALLMFGATPLVFHAWLVAVPAWLALAVAFTRRIRLEEDLLRREIPGYAAYMERTGALWPRPVGRPAG